MFERTRQTTTTEKKHGQCHAFTVTWSVRENSGKYECNKFRIVHGNRIYRT